VLNSALVSGQNKRLRSFSLGDVAPATLTSDARYPSSVGSVLP
jgi:hypothetical protein